jgi:hypothetical protein
MAIGPLYNESVIKKKFSDIEVTTKQRKLANVWIDKIKNKELEKEVENYDIFKQIILIDLLGYPHDEIKFEVKDVEFSVTDVKGITHVVFEAKGTKTKDLFARQNYDKKEQEHPVLQTVTDMQRFEPPAAYGVCTNYDTFVLLDRDRGSTKCHKFVFTDIKNNIDKLKEFIGIFSYKKLVTEKSLVTLYEKSLIAEKEFTKEFYKLFHGTRLMMIKIFQKNPFVGKNEAIHFTQTFLNRLIFIFFVQDQERSSNSQIFTTRLYSILESVELTEHSKKIYDEISELFMAFDKGDQKLGIFGFGGELFNEVIPSNIYFSDLIDPDFFSDVKYDSKLSKSKRLNEKTQKIIDRYENQLNPIVTNLLLMDSFDFSSEVNVNILGHIFEQSISDLEDLKEGEISKRKQDGVYYTPEFITDHICRNTIIPYLSKTSVSTTDELIQEYFDDVDILEKKIHELKILDPACGSGAFLNKAIDLLLEIFKEIQHVKESKGKYSTDDQFQLTSWNDESQIRRIIENNIYGVDLNSESIEITKLSVYLKLAAENRRLIGLSKNFQSGNSIISDRIVDPNGIHWENSFPEIFSPLLKVQGFDIVLGNPPYLKIEHLNENERKFFQKHFQDTYMMRYDAYGLFLSKGTSLLRKGGILGMIIPSTMLNNITFSKLRKFLLTSTTILQIVNLGGKVFEGVNVDSLIIVFKNSSVDKFETEIYDVLKYGKGITTAKKTNTIDFQNISKEPNFSFEIRITKEFAKILEKMEENSIPLSRVSKSFQGFVSGKNEVYLVTDDEIKEESLEPVVCKPSIFGDDIKRYGYTKPNCNVIYLTRNEKISDFPGVKKRLVPYKSILENKREVKLGRQPWYALHWPRNSENFERKEKVIVQAIRNLSLKRRIVATIDYDKLYADHTINVLIPKNPDYDLRYVLGILNSNLINYLFQKKYVDINIKAVYLDAIPIPKTSSENQHPVIEKVDQILILNEKISDVTKKFTDKALENFNLKKLSNKLYNFEDLDLNELLNEFKKLKVILPLQKQDEWKIFFEQQKKIKYDLKQEIEQLDNGINKIVYALYGLSDDDIKIIEKTE